MKRPADIPVFGDWSYRGDCPKEVAEQITFINRIRTKYPDSYGAVIVHNRNEGKRTMAQIQREKMEGLTTGAPDISIPAKVSFLCELKRRNQVLSAISDKQLSYLRTAQKLGAFVCVALGCDAAEAAFDEWRRLHVE